MKNMTNKILVSGLLNIETTVAVRGFPIHYFPIDYPFFGVNSNVAGVGFNVAKALTSLGDSVELVSFLGNDYESGRILGELDSCGISTHGIRRELKNTPTSVILFDPEGKRQVYCDLKDIQEQMLSPDTLTDSFSDVSAAVLCNINFNRELIKKAREMKVLTATDVHVLSNTEDDYNRDFMENADILFLSDEALPCAPEEFIQRLHERYHSKVIVIGMGAKGALLLDNLRSGLYGRKGSQYRRCGRLVVLVVPALLRQGIFRRGIAQKGGCFCRNQDRLQRCVGRILFRRQHRRGYPFHIKNTPRRLCSSGNHPSG